MYKQNVCQHSSSSNAMSTCMQVANIFGPEACSSIDGRGRLCKKLFHLHLAKHGCSVHQVGLYTSPKKWGGGGD